MFEKLLKRPVIIIFSTVLILIAGMSALRDLPVDLFPNLNYPLINIITHYPAGTAQDMEQLISRPIETAMMGLNQLQRVRSNSTPGFSQVTVEFSWGVDAEQARQRVFARLAQIQSQLPINAKPELENIGSSLAMLSTYVLQSHDETALHSWVQTQLKPQLSMVSGVARVQIMGGGELSWRVDIDPLKLQQTGLNTIQISAAIAQANSLNTGGVISQQGRDLLVRTDGRLLSLEDLKNVVVSSNNGLPIKLVDIADVYQGKKPQRFSISQDGSAAVAINIQKQANASTLNVSEGIDNKLKNITLPQGVKITKFYDQAEIIGLTYKNMRNNLLSGALLAIITVMFFLGGNRSSLAIALTFPLALLATLWLMNIFHVGLNLMTLGALTVAIGMVADDAIIVIENIDRHLHLNKSPWQAAIDGTKEILSADIAGTFTILAAFSPLILISGLAGRLFHPFGLSFSLLLLFSLLVSVTLIPLIAVYWLKPKQKQAINNIPLADRIIKKTTKINLQLLNLLVKHKKLTLISSLFLLIFSTILLTFNPLRFLPLLDENSLLLSYQLAAGTSLQESNRVGESLTQQILTMPQVKSVFRRTGSPSGSFYLEGTNQGELIVRLDNQKNANALIVKQQLEQLLKSSPGIVGRVTEPTSEKLDESLSGMPALFGISIYSTSLNELYQATNQIEQVAIRTEGVNNVVNNTKIAVDQLLIRLKSEKLALYNVSAKLASETIKQAMQGTIVSQAMINQQNIAIYLRYKKNSRENIDDLKSILVPNNQEVNIPLSQIATITRSPSYPAIEHQQGLRSLTLTAEIVGDPRSILNNLSANIDKLDLSNSIQVSYTGEYQQLLDTSTKMIWVVLAAITLVYAIIVLQLGNFIDPLVVLVKLPLDFIGAAIALFISQQALDLTVIIGFITLMGVSTNNGIMLLTFTKNFRQQGMNAYQAISKAARLRTRPMLLTHLTTLLALIPAAIGFGEGPQLLQPLAIMLFGGLTAGTLLTLNLLPVIYLATERWR